MTLCRQFTRALSAYFLATIGAAVLLSTVSFSAEKKKPDVVRVVLVGDSTVASRGGWGDAFGRLFSDDAECLNMARAGRSSKSFRDEGHWRKVLDAKPDWVLIQFGHNDQPGKGLERETDARTTFREYLRRYVRDARKIGATPVLVTSLTRRDFDASGKIQMGRVGIAAGEPGATEEDILSGYVAATRSVAAALKVPLIDLNARSIEQLNRIGPKAAVIFDPKGRDPKHPDKTHLSARGAKETAKLVAEETRRVVPELATLLKK